MDQRHRRGQCLDPVHRRWRPVQNHLQLRPLRTPDSQPPRFRLPEHYRPDGAGGAPLKITQELGGLSTTLVDFMPLLVTVGFLASIWGAIGVHMMDGQEGVKGLTTMLGAKIAMLVILFAAVRLAPTLVEEANSTLLGLSVYSITFEYDTSAGPDVRVRADHRNHRHHRFRTLRFRPDWSAGSREWVDSRG